MRDWETICRQAYAVECSGESLTEFAHAKRINRFMLYDRLSKWKKARGL